MLSLQRPLWLLQNLSLTPLRFRSQSRFRSPPRSPHGTLHTVLSAARLVVGYLRIYIGGHRRLHLVLDQTKRQVTLYRLLRRSHLLENFFAIVIQELLRRLTDRGLSSSVSSTPYSSIFCSASTMFSSVVTVWDLIMSPIVEPLP